MHADLAALGALGALGALVALIARGVIRSGRETHDGAGAIGEADHRDSADHDGRRQKRGNQAAATGTGRGMFGRHQPKT